MDMENRRGPWSREEKKFIAENCGRIDYREIAAQLRRNAEAVKRYVKANHASELIERAKIAEYDIQNTPIWKDLEQQFSAKELSMFLYHWGRIIGQFKDDVYPTEEIQVIDTIKLELLMNRIVIEQRKLLQDVQELEVAVTREKEMDVPDQAIISNLERQMGVLRAAQDSISTDFRNMLKEKNNILKEMKATRDARIKHLEASKHNFLGLLRKIIQDKNFRARLGREMEKMRLATDVEYERLSEWHEYDDGEVDQPLLTPENTLEE
jgi:hypothetical protein